ncbi:MAG: helix-turn-helix transcriptional regulator [Bacteroidetes bacterium]|nr:helix-turn-helix transcriptional regulator [Bacteroidota bacterium]
MAKLKPGRPRKKNDTILTPQEVECLKKLGIRIKNLRIKAGFSNYEYFAYENNISRAQYGKYENGSNINFLTLYKIIKAHNLSLKDFFGKGFEEL